MDDRWISVDDRLPDSNNYSVLIAYWEKYLDFPIRRIAVYENGCWYLSTGDTIDTGKVSHWAYLPSKEGLVKPKF